MRSSKRLQKIGFAAAWLIGGGLVVGTVFAIAFFTAMRVEMRSTEITVPALAGMTMEQAREQTQPLDLVLEVVDQRNDPRVASGRVIEQMPPEGARVRRGRKLKLIVSLGGRVLKVPNIVGQASRAVTIKLRQEGFLSGDEAQVASFDQPAGRVLAQVPPAASSVVPSSRIHRLVSAGAPEPVWVMPDLGGLSRAEVERWIRESGLRRGAVRRVRSAGLIRETVVAQLPKAGYPVRPKDIVELAVAD